MNFVKKYYPYFKWLIILAAYTYLLYVLFAFDDYETLWQQWEKAFATNWHYLLFVFLLLPLNWLFESYKWQLLLRDVLSISLKQSVVSVFGGAMAAFFTPNRIGEFPARSLFLQDGGRAKSIVLGMLGSLSQTLIIVLCGLPAVAIYFSMVKNKDLFFNPIIGMILFVVIAGCYFFLPELCRKLNSLITSEKIKKLLILIADMKRKRLFHILLISFLRYLIFCTQFFFMLSFFDVHLTPLQGFVAIAVNYLFVTFAPAVGFSEGIVRSSIAVLILSVFSSNTIGVAIAGVSIWLVNFVLPMLIGSVFMSKTDLAKS